MFNWLRKCAIPKYVPVPEPILVEPKLTEPVLVIIEALKHVDDWETEDIREDTRCYDKEFTASKMMKDFLVGRKYTHKKSKLSLRVNFSLYRDFNDLIISPGFSDYERSAIHHAIDKYDAIIIEKERSVQHKKDLEQRNKFYQLLKYYPKNK